MLDRGNISVKKLLLFFIFVSLIFTGCTAKKGEPEVKQRGASELVFIKNFKSNILNNERNIAVYLPPDYKENSGKKYPVLYMHDGQNLFTEESSGSKAKWKVRETADKLINENKIEDIIIVGIYNTPDRIDEYTQSYTEKYKGGKGKDYARFVVEEVKPYIDSNYRTLKDRENTGIAGSSLGGLISLYMGWNYPETFKKIGAISPSFWWDSGIMQKEIEAYKGEKKDLNIWIDAGNAEETDDRNNNGIIDMVDDAREMVSALNKKDFITQRDVMFYEVTAGMHNEDSWAERFDQVLLYMFSKEKDAKPQALSAEGWDITRLSQNRIRYLNPVVTYSNGLKQTLLNASFNSSAEDIIKVDEKGFITPLKEGNVEVSVSGLGLSSKKVIRVQN